MSPRAISRPEILDRVQAIIGRVQKAFSIFPGSSPLELSRTLISDIKRE